MPTTVALPLVTLSWRDVIVHGECLGRKAEQKCAQLNRGCVEVAAIATDLGNIKLHTDDARSQGRRYGVSD
jgi:hypothetical protein